MRICRVCGKQIHAGMTDGNGDIYLHEVPCFAEYMDETYGVHCWTEIGGNGDGCGGYYIVKDTEEPCGFRGTGFYYTEWEDDNANCDATLKNNPYFTEMAATGKAWEKARQDRLVRKQEIIDLYGYDSEELKLWYEKEKKITFPFSQGQNNAYRAWSTSLLRGSSELECEDLPWDKDMADFVSTLRIAGFTTLVVTDQSTALMRSLFALTALGCRLVGLCRITRHETRWGEEEPSKVEGIRFEL